MSAKNVDSFRSNLYDVALSSNDELFHYMLFQWLISFQMTETLLSLKSKFIEKFLQNEKSNPVIADLLWKYYAKHGQFLQSAQVLMDLANSSEYVQI